MGERPLLEIELPDLRLIDDRTWAETQRRLADYLGRAGRKPNADSARQPKLLNRLCVCGKHQRPLTAGGKGNAYLFCPECRIDPERALVSLLHRKVGTKLLCESWRC